jgi:hypothetical protein
MVLDWPLPEPTVTLKTLHQELPQPADGGLVVLVVKPVPNPTPHHRFQLAIIVGLDDRVDSEGLALHGEEALREVLMCECRIISQGRESGDLLPNDMNQKIERLLAKLAGRPKLIDNDRGHALTSFMQAGVGGA